jgi:hypothetical protein
MVTVIGIWSASGYTCASCCVLRDGVSSRTSGQDRVCLTSNVQHLPNWPARDGRLVYDAPGAKWTASERAGETRQLHQDPMTGADRIMLSCEYTGGERDSNALSRTLRLSQPAERTLSGGRRKTRGPTALPQSQVGHVGARAECYSKSLHPCRCRRLSNSQHLPP